MFCFISPGKSGYRSQSHNHQGGGPYFCANSGSVRRMLVLSGLVMSLLLLSGCESLGYYYQSVQGHLSLMHQSRPIKQLLQDKDTDPDLKKKLKLVLEVREFATAHLGLPVNESYHSFAALDRKAVVWNVVATPEFSVAPKQWCYPVIGCASYRGYFSLEQAQQYGDGLRRDGLDVAVEPAAAYSTLGWFDDPLPSTIINWPQPQLVGLIFHELAHQQLYVADDSAFNEAFASAVEQVGVGRWYSARNDSAGLNQWRQRQRRKQEFIHLLLQSREHLQQIYVKSQQPAEMRRQKADAFVALRDGYLKLKRGWGGYSGYDHWFKQELNNARLASVATYAQLVPAFLVLLEQSGGDLGGFYQACEKLAELPLPQRRSKLQELLRQ